MRIQTYLGIVLNDMLLLQKANLHFKLQHCNFVAFIKCFTGFSYFVDCAKFCLLNEFTNLNI